MSHTVNAPRSRSSRPHVAAPARLPRLNDGVRWIITRAPHEFAVRAYRGPQTRLRVFDTATRRPVLKVTNLPGSDRLPDSAVLFELLRWTDPRLDSPLTAHLSGLCWHLTETRTGFDLKLRVLAPLSMPGPRMTALPIPLHTSSPARARQAAIAALALVPAADGSTGPVSDTLLQAVAQALNSRV